MPPPAVILKDLGVPNPNCKNNNNKGGDSKKHDLLAKSVVLLSSPCGFSYSPLKFAFALAKPSQNNKHRPTERVNRGDSKSMRCAHLEHCPGEQCGNQAGHHKKTIYDQPKHLEPPCYSQVILTDETNF